MYRCLATLLTTTLLCAALAPSSASAQARRSRAQAPTLPVPTLTSDKTDYAPGTIAVLTGSGFVPHEIVTLLVVHADGSPSTGADHDPWVVAANRLGRFVTTWHVCEDDCVGQLLLATADGAFSGLHAETKFTDNHVCGTGVLVSVTPVGGSCSAFTPAVGSGPDNYEVEEGGTYSMTFVGVTECSGDTITVFVQSSGTGNFCFNATGGSGTYIGTFTMPNPACNTLPVSYKCGADTACTHPNSFGARGPTSGCGGVHLRASNFDGSCVKTGDDTECAGVGCVTFTLDFETDDTGAPLADKQIVDSELDGGPSYPVTLSSSSNLNSCGTVAGTAAVYDSDAPPHGSDPDLAVGSGNILILQTDANLSTCAPGFFCSGNDDEDGGTLVFDFNAPVTPISVDLIDIDASGPDEVVTITLIDGDGDTRTYVVPANWTGDLVDDGTGQETLFLNTTVAQPGFTGMATASENGVFDPTAVISIVIESGGDCSTSSGGSGAIDNLVWCQ